MKTTFIFNKIYVVKAYEGYDNPQDLYYMQRTTDDVWLKWLPFGRKWCMVSPHIRNLKAMKHVANNLIQ